MSLEAYVASPILNPAGEVIGTLYGERQASGSSLCVAPITELEAMLVEVLSCSVAAGLARVQQEQVALEARDSLRAVLHARTVSPAAGRSRRCCREETPPSPSCSATSAGSAAFPNASEPALTFDWINSVMGVLSDCVIQHKGVLVDYIGDELIAMWGAPEELPDHGVHACQAALAMLEQMPALSAQWSAIIGEPTSYAIGINTGSGPRGQHRVEEEIQVRTAGQHGESRQPRAGGNQVRPDTAGDHRRHRTTIGPEFPTRRLCSVEVVNIAEPIDLYELRAAADNAWSDLKARYESALAAYEQAEFHTATRILGNLLTEYPDDGPTVILLSRAVEMLASGHDEFSPVWRLAGK